MIEITLSHGSPFVRKVRIAATVKGLDDRIEFIDPQKDAARAQALRAANPLDKIPAARLDDGTVIFDSHVISEYLDTLSPSPRLFPAIGVERFKALTLAALADGIMEAAVLVIYEGRYRPPEKHHPEWVDRQQAKADAGLAYLESNVPAWTGHINYGDITLACALGFIDNRQGPQWRKRCPALAAWFGKFAAAVPAWAATEPPKT